MVFDNEKRAIPEPVALVHNHNKFSEQIHVTVQEAEKLVVDWTPEEERRAKWKVDLTLLPILMLGFYALQLDRGNLGNALTDTIMQDIKVNQNLINVGTQLLSAGIVILEIPSNIILQRVGPQRWLSGQIIAWGLVATFQMFISNKGGYLSTRLLLGLMESGYIPGGLYVLSTWYTKRELALRTALYFVGNMLASATTGLIAFGILRLAGRNGLAGWQWLFMLEGLFTICVGFVFLLLLPASPSNPSPIFFPKWKYFSDRESHILHTRILIDDPNKARGGIRITGKDVLRTVTNWRLWPHLLITLTALQPASVLMIYIPTIIKGLGYTKLTANALSSVGGFGTIILTPLNAFGSDLTNRRAFFVWLPLTWTLILISIVYSQSVSNSWRQYSIWTLLNAGIATFHPVNGAWLSINSKTPQERSISLALWIMSANLSGVCGAQIFRAEDAPLYRKGVLAIVVLTATGWGITIFQGVQYYLSNRRLDKVYGKVDRSRRESDSESQSSRDSDLSVKDFRYVV